MVLLSGMMRAADFSGSRAPIDAWFQGRQWGPWAMRNTRAYLPPQGSPPQQAAPPAPADPAASLHSLTQLRERGVIDDAEFEKLRARLGA